MTSIHINQGDKSIMGKSDKVGLTLHDRLALHNVTLQLMGQ